MPRAIWTGTLSFGLLNIPIQLMSGEKRVDISFRMLDQRNQAPVRYERVNAETGEEVPWKDIVKAYEYSKGSYVVLEESDIAAAASETKETVELEAFVPADQINPAYMEKPYILVPGKKAEKGYVLLREILKKTGRVGIGRVVIRTREYLAMVRPHDDALMLILLRFPQELVDPAEHKLPEGGIAQWKISPKEMEMATALLESMAGEWQPTEYKDEFRARLHEVINKRIKSKGATTTIEDDGDAMPENAATNVVDFMALLKKSLESKAGGPGTPAGKAKKAGRASKAEKAIEEAVKPTPKRKRA